MSRITEGGARKYLTDSIYGMILHPAVALSLLTSIGYAQEPVPVAAASCEAFASYVKNHGLPISPQEHPVWGITLPDFEKVRPRLTRGAEQGGSVSRPDR
jgi:hypothetical protein